MEKFCDAISVTYFGNVIMMMLPKLRNNFVFLKFNFVIISLKNHKFSKSHNFKSLILKVNGR